MDRIFFTKNINRLLESKFNSDFGDNAIVSYHAMYDEPQVRARKVIEWEKYKTVYSTFEPSLIVLIGINRMITPSNRCDFIHAHLTVLTPQIPKVVIDTAPFIGEPWRLYFHYQVANCFDGFGANYSYPIEGEWLRWFERDAPECKFSPENLKSLIVNTYTDLSLLTTTFELYEPDNRDKEWYAEAKRFEFEKFRSAKMTILNLLRVTNKHFNMKISYDSYLDSGKISVPDVGVYRFVVEESRRRQDIYNLFTTADEEDSFL